MRWFFVLFFVLILCLGVSAKEYTDSVEKYFLEDDTYLWSPKVSGQIDKISVEGDITGDGMVKVSIIRGGRQYQIFSRTQADEFVIGDLVELSEGTDIGMTLMYGDGNWDADNDGRVDTSGGVDFSMQTYFFGLFDENYLCTAWDVFDIEEDSYQTSCYGSETCCSFLGYKSSLDRWDNDYVVIRGKDGAGESNIVLSRVVYYNVTHVSYSNYDALEAHFIDRNLDGGAENFSDLFSSKNNLLRISVEDGTVLHLKGIKYNVVDSVKEKDIVLRVESNLVSNESSNDSSTLSNSSEVLGGEPVSLVIPVATMFDFNDSLLVSGYTAGKIGLIEKNESYESWMITQDANLSFAVPLAKLGSNLSRLHFYSGREIHPVLLKNDGKLIYYDVSVKAGKLEVVIDNLEAKENEVLYAAPIRPVYYLMFSIFVVLAVLIFFGLKRTALFEFYTDIEEYKAHVQVKEISSVLDRMKRM